MKIHVAVSKDPNAEGAGAEAVSSVKHVFGPSQVDLAFLFFSPHYAGEVESLIELIVKGLSPRVLVGCMGEGVIAEESEFEETPVVTLWVGHFPKVHLIPFHLTFTEMSQGYDLKGWPDEMTSSKDSQTFILLADPFSTPVEELFSRMEQYCPGAPAIGGVASGGTDLGENFLVLNEEIVHGGVVGVAVSGPVSVRPIVSQGCKPIGDRYVITKAERNIIYELGGVPTLDRLQSTIDSLGAEGGRHAAMALQIGVAFDEHQERFERGDFLIRGLIGADQQSGGIAVSDLVEEGQTIQFHLRDPNAASEELNMLLAKDRVDFPDKSPKGALLFSCNGRGRRFFPEPHHDIKAVRNRSGAIPVAGFFAAGEIGPVAGQNFIHGFTASVAIFSES